MEDEDIFKALKIPVKAIEMVAALKFLYKEKEDMGDLLESCLGKNLKEINKYINNERKERLENNKITKIKFKETFKIDKKKALEGLFQEPLNQVKIDFAPLDPERIFTIHSMHPVGIRYMNLISLL